MANPKKSCSVSGCSVTEFDKITQHRVKETWKPCLQWKTKRPYYCCTLHFRSSDYYLWSERLKKDAFPSIQHGDKSSLAKRKTTLEEEIKSLISTSQDDDQIFEDATSSSNQQEYVPEPQSSGEEEISGNKGRKRRKTGDVTTPENLPENCLHESLLIPKIAVDDINPLDFVKVKSEPQEEDNNENFPHFVVCNESIKQEIKEEMQDDDCIDDNHEISLNESLEQVLSEVELMKRMRTKERLKETRELKIQREIETFLQLKEGEQEDEGGLLEKVHVKRDEELTKLELKRRKDRDYQRKYRKLQKMKELGLYQPQSEEEKNAEKREKQRIKSRKFRERKRCEDPEKFAEMQAKYQSDYRARQLADNPREMRKYWRDAKNKERKKKVSDEIISDNYNENHLSDTSENILDPLQEIDSIQCDSEMDENSLQVNASTSENFDNFVDCETITEDSVTIKEEIKEERVEDNETLRSDNLSGFSCDKCSKSFKEKQLLDLHKWIHN